MIQSKIAERNKCYTEGRARTRTFGVLLHDTATMNTGAERFAHVFNVYKPNGLSVCVHCFVDDTSIIEILPDNWRCWGCGSGAKGSGNDNYVQIEMCLPAGVEVDNKTWQYKIKAGSEEEVKKRIRRTLDNAEVYMVHILKKYKISSIDAGTVTSHYEAHARGIASNHADPARLLKLIGMNMDKVRAEVYKLMSMKDDVNNNSEYKLVRVTCTTLNVRKEPRLGSDVTCRVHKGEVFTIVDYSADRTWGKLKSGAGWICLRYTEDL